MYDRFIALVPAYQPEPVLIHLLAQLRAAQFDVVVVDDGSGPGYAALFAQAAQYAAVLTHPHNRGKGAALKTGFAHIWAHGAQGCIVVTVDADGQHKVADAIRVCEAARREPQALILGSREFKGEVPPRSRFGNAVTRAVYRLSTGLRVRDTQTGLRAFGGALLPRLLAIPGERYEYEMQVLLTFAREKIPIREVAVETVYLRQNASSHFHTLRDSCRIYKEILKFSASSLAGFVVDYLLYSLLLLCLPELWMANVGARLVSAAVNYTLNRQFVFRSHGSVAQSALQYLLLAALILCANTLVLGWLVGELGIHRLAAKLLTEALFFLLSWLVQRQLIFRRKGPPQPAAAPPPKNRPKNGEPPPAL